MKQPVKRYPVLTFFILTTALGWLAVIVGTALMPIDAEHPSTQQFSSTCFLQSGRLDKIVQIGYNSRRVSHE